MTSANWCANLVIPTTDKSAVKMNYFGYTSICMTLISLIVNERRRRKKKTNICGGHNVHTSVRGESLRDNEGQPGNRPAFAERVQLRLDTERDGKSLQLSVIKKSRQVYFDGRKIKLERLQCAVGFVSSFFVFHLRHLEMCDTYSRCLLLLNWILVRFLMNKNSIKP